MAEDDQERTHDPTPAKLARARAEGDVPVSREGAVAGGYLAALLGVLLAGEVGARRIGDLLLPLIDQPDAFLDLTGEGLREGLRVLCLAVGLALAPLFGLLLAGSLLPYVFQGSIAFALPRLQPKLSRFSPMGAIGRLFGARAWFEFGKNMVKMGVIGVACFATARPLYENSVALVGMDVRALLPRIYAAVVALLGIVTLVAAVIAGVDVPYQRWVYLRRHRMSLQDIKDEMRNSDGNPEIKAKIRRLRQNMSRNRMMADVTRASVVIANPTHFAVALRYERGKDAAPVVVAKGVDLIAQKIKEVARENGVPVTEDRPLARALHAAAEIGQVIPREHFEAVAKIIGVLWARKRGGGR